MSFIKFFMSFHTCLGWNLLLHNQPGTYVFRVPACSTYHLYPLKLSGNRPHPLQRDHCSKTYLVSAKKDILKRVGGVSCVPKSCLHWTACARHLPPAMTSFGSTLSSPHGTGIHLTRILVIWLPTAVPSGSIIVTPNGFWADFMSIWCPKVNWQTHSATENTASRSFSIWVYLPSVPIKALPALLRRFCLSAAPRHRYPYDTSNYPPVKLKVLKEGTGLVTAPALSLLTVLDLLTITKPHKCIKSGNLGNYSESTPPACPQLDLFLTIQFLHF